MLECPNCRSNNLRQSSPKNRKEQYLKYAGRLMFRCRDCRWRGVIKTRHLTLKKLPRWQLVLVAVVTLVVVFLLKRFLQ